MSSVLAQRHRGAEHLTTLRGDFNLSSNDRGIVVMGRGCCSVGVCSHSFQLLRHHLIHWLSVWRSDLLSEQSRTGLAGSFSNRSGEAAFVKLNTVRFQHAVNYLKRSVCFSHGDQLSLMGFVSRTPPFQPLGVLFPSRFSAAAPGEEEP